MIKRLYHYAKNRKAIECADTILDNSSTGYRYDSAIDAYGENTVSYLISKNLAITRSVSGGISIGDWSYKFKGLELTEKGEKIAISDKDRKAISSRIGSAARAIVLYLIFPIVALVAGTMIVIQLTQ